jgi:hypothetical protein
VKKISTLATRRNKIFNQPKLTIGLDLGDRTSHYTASWMRQAT